MFLSPEQMALGRRTFLKALAGTPALGLLGAAATLKGPVRGGPVRLGCIGVGAQGRAHLNNIDPAFGEIRAICDINPASLLAADQVLAKRQLPPARHYVEWRDMLGKEDLEGVLIAVPLWMHADVAVGCLEAGKHVLCEKMMAWDVEGCERMAQAAAKSDRLLEIGYQRRYSGVYQAAYEGIVRKGLLGEVHHVRMVWHRNGNWRRKGDPPAPDYDPSAWGYPTWDHLWNWRLYWKYSKGLFAELASHQVNAVNWFLGAVPAAASASGGVQRFNDGREVYDHIYATFEYPGGITATYSSVESNAYENRYEVFFGTKGTLLVRNESEALLFEEGGARSETGVQVTSRENAPAADASETRPGAAAGAASNVSGTAGRPSATRQEISSFCAAVRVGTPLACGPQQALHSARASIVANDAVAKRQTLPIVGSST
jgi:predicted dehydrogenase